MSIRLFSCEFAVFLVLGFNVNAKNLYNDWAQKNATSLNGPAVSDDAMRNPSAPMLQRIKHDALSCKDDSGIEMENDLTSGRKIVSENAFLRAILLLSEESIVNVARDVYCFENNSERDRLNKGTPKTLDEAITSGLYFPMSEELSILHNFKESLRLDTPLDRLIAGIGASAEYRAWKDHKMDRSEWKYLDPDLPNIKLIETNGGHKEVVYNRHTKRKVDNGNNQGTYNIFNQDSTIIQKVLHLLSDVGDWGVCGTPTDNEKITAKVEQSLTRFLESVTAKDKQVMKDEGSHQPDLHSLNLDDPNGDWCKCEERGEKPGCEANMEASEKGYVVFGCTKCKKVNVKYAKMALALEQKMKGAGVKVMWHGSNARANARKAASESNR